MTPQDGQGKVGYCATAPCGCTYALWMGVPSKDILKDLENGAVMDRVTAEEGRGRIVSDCPHKPKWGGLT